MYKIVHLPTGNYVVDITNKMPLQYFTERDLVNQIFENRLAVFRKLNWCNDEDDTVYYVDIAEHLNDNGIIPKFFFEIVEETSFWSV